MAYYNSWNDYCRDEDRRCDGFGSEDYFERVDIATAERDDY